MSEKKKIQGKEAEELKDCKGAEKTEKNSRVAIYVCMYVYIYMYTTISQYYTIIMYSS